MPKDNEPPALIALPEAKGALEPVQYIPKKADEKKIIRVELPAPLPPVPPTNDEPPPPAPKLERANEMIPPPSPVAAPELKETPKPAIVPTPPSAAPQPWSPPDTAPPSPVIKPPDFPRAVEAAPIESATPRHTPSVPVNNPSGRTPEGTSRFVVPPKAPTTPEPVVAAPAAPAYEQPSTPNMPRRFTMIRTWKSPEANPAPGPLPKLTEVSRPSVADLHAPAQDPLLGTLTPQLTVEKRGPLLHKVGGPLKYQIVLRNVGAISANQVRVEDEIPGAALIATTPVTTQQQGDRLVWILPALRPGEERVFQEELQPVRPGDVVSTTSVHVYASTSFRTKLDGDIVSTAPNTPLPAMPSAIPPSPAPTASGPSLQLPNASTPPNPFPPALNPFSAPTTGTPTLPPAAPAPPLTDGPALNSPPKQMPMTVDVKALPTVGVGQEIVFEVIVSNKGATPLTGMMLFGKIPTGFSHPEGDNIGADLPDLPAGKTKSFKMRVMAVAPGKHAVEVRVTAAPNYELVARPVVNVEPSGPNAPQPTSLPETRPASGNQADALSNLQVSVQGRDNPLEIGKETIYQVRITNIGSSALTNVQASVTLSSGLDSTGFAQAPTVYRINGRDLVFAPLPRLQVGETKTIHLGVRGLAAGQQTVRVLVVSDQSRVPTVREERTQVTR
jgi:uncharacterized repeat protein (TIGR01451 family)